MRNIHLHLTLDKRKSFKSGTLDKHWSFKWWLSFLKWIEALVLIKELIFFRDTEEINKGSEANILSLKSRIDNK
jgi:hypothetical protein